MIPCCCCQIRSEEDELTHKILLDTIKSTLISEGCYYNKEDDIKNRPIYARFFAKFFNPITFTIAGIGFLFLLLLYTLIFDIRKPEVKFIRLQKADSCQVIK